MNVFKHLSKILLLSLLIALLAVPAAADFIQPDLAATAARAWSKSLAQGKTDPGQITELLAYGAGKFNPAAQYFDQSSVDLPQLYLAIFSDRSFVLMAADDNSVPVLAYSGTQTASAKDFPPAFLEWVGLYAAQINAITASGLDLTQNRQLWQDLLGGQSARLDLERSIEPLLATNWDQGWPYNELCPLDPAGPGGHVYAGCVATAMGMVMKYWNHPQTGVGNHTYYAPGYGYQNANFGATTYLWDEMPNSVGSSNLPVATLLYHCGVAVEMNYAPDGSGAQSADAAWALASNFRYPQAAIQNRMSYNDAQWNTLLQAQLDNGSPMYYSGSGSGGHAFVIDGYQAANYYHFNFGWSGSYNGYYYMNAINPGGSDFNNWNSAIINSIPENYSIANTRVKLETAGGETVGNNFTLSVTTNPLLGSWNVDHYEFTLFYDHTFIDYIGSTTANSISAQGTLTVSETEPGSLQVCWDGPSTLIGGGTLATFTFLPSDVGDFLFDILDMQYNTSAVTNTQYLMVGVEAPVASLAESQISMTNVMHLGYQQTGVSELNTSYLLPSWNVTHYQFDLAYDPAKLEYVGIQTEGTLSEGLDPVVVMNSPGSLSISCDADPRFTGSGSLLKLAFSAIGNGSAITVTNVVPSNFYYNGTLINSVGSANFILSPTTAAQDDLAEPAPVLTVYPNPLRDQARITLSGKSGQETELKVYDLKGRRVDTFLIKSGTEFNWDLKDSSKNRLAAGIYLISWSQGPNKGTEKILILK
ncbi:MAG: C10 family peptidase [Candidatus Cloacimonetes bacterium]|nr:C10 family peptidase [Candidatus Cloacimonadota bacterium]